MLDACLNMRECCELMRIALVEETLKRTRTASEAADVLHCNYMTVRRYDSDVKVRKEIELMWRDNNQ
jgi:hypothetical protein